MENPSKKADFIQREHYINIVANSKPSIIFLFSQKKPCGNVLGFV